MHDFDYLMQASSNLKHQGNSCIIPNVSVNAVFASPSTNCFVDFRKVDLSPKLLEKYLFSSAPYLARQLIFNSIKSD